MATAHCQETRFDRVVVDNNFPDGYQVEVADVNGDRKPDIIALGGSTCAWYENPTWKKRIVTAGKQTPGIISSATADLDNDGKAEIAIAYDFEMNEPTGWWPMSMATAMTRSSPATAAPIIVSRCMISTGRAGNGPAPYSTTTLPPRTCAEAISTATVRQTWSPSAAPRIT